MGCGLAERAQGRGEREGAAPPSLLCCRSRCPAATCRLTDTQAVTMLSYPPPAPDTDECSFLGPGSGPRGRRDIAKLEKMTSVLLITHNTGSLYPDEILDEASAFPPSASDIAMVTHTRLAFRHFVAHTHEILHVSRSMRWPKAMSISLPGTAGGASPTSFASGTRRWGVRRRKTVEYFS